MDTQRAPPRGCDLKNLFFWCKLKTQFFSHTAAMCCLTVCGPSWSSADCVPSKCPDLTSTITKHKQQLSPLPTESKSPINSLFKASRQGTPTVQRSWFVSTRPLSPPPLSLLSPLVVFLHPCLMDKDIKTCWSELSLKHTE